MAKQGFGAEFWFDNASGTLTQCGEVLSVKPPSYSRAGINTTHHGSAGGVDTQMPSGIVNITPGTVTLQIDPGSTEDVMLATASKDGREGTYKFVIPGDTTPQGYSGEGWIVYEVDDVAPDGKITATVTVNPSGAFSQADEA